MLILVVSYIMTATLPLVRLIQLVLLGGVDERLHSNRIAAVILLQVVDVEADGVTLANISHGKEEPLGVVERIMVEVQKQIVFAVPDPFDLAQVARLKLSVEEDGLIVDV